MRDAAHLIRLALVLALAAVLFLALRSAVIPTAFGQFGHYRPGALEDNRKQELRFAGQADCAVCHEDQDAERRKGRHAGIACEACHGPRAKHAADPGTGKPALPEVVALCSNCHEKDASKPRWFPQVNSAGHSQGLNCNSCHKAHTPKI